MGRPKGSSNKTATKRKMNKDPNRPKRPTSAYFYYVAAQREEAAKRGESISRVAEWTKVVSAKWRDLTDSEKTPYEKQAKIDRARYESQNAIYKGTQGKDVNKPKRPQSSYFLFLGDFRLKNKSKFDENKELLRAAGEAWKALTASEKKPYEAQAEVLKRQYEKDMKDYNSGKAKKPKIEVAEAKNGRDEEEEEDDEEEEDEEDDDDEDDD